MKVLKFRLLPTEGESRAIVLRTKFAEYLHSQGFDPNHWYANWKKLAELIWLIFKGDDRTNPSCEMYAEVAMRDTAPNIAGSEFLPKNAEHFKKVVEEQVKPMVLNLLEKSPIKTQIISDS